MKKVKVRYSKTTIRLLTWDVSNSTELFLTNKWAKLGNVKKSGREYKNSHSFLKKDTNLICPNIHKLDSFIGNSFAID